LRSISFTQRSSFSAYIYRLWCVLDSS
jgi:hypothetical protein